MECCRTGGSDLAFEVGAFVTVLGSIKRALVSGADAKYFGYLTDMIDSVKRVAPDFAVDICVFDLGLTSLQQKDLSRRGIQWKQPLKMLDIDQRGSAPGFVASMAKLTMPEQFPGYDTYMWVDADIWFQSSVGVSWPFLAAEQGGLAIVPQIDRCYTLEAGILAWRMKRMMQALDAQVFRELSWRPYFNGGLFALRQEEPHWKLLRSRYEIALRRGPLRDGLVQACLVEILFKDCLKFTPLPASCNWLVHLARPIRGSSKGEWVEPYFPHGQIHALHLTARTKEEASLRYAP